MDGINALNAVNVVCIYFPMDLSSINAINATCQIRVFRIYSLGGINALNAVRPSFFDLMVYVPPLKKISIGGGKK